MKFYGGFWLEPHSSRRRSEKQNMASLGHSTCGHHGFCKVQWFAVRHVPALYSNGAADRRNPAGIRGWLRWTDLHFSPWMVEWFQWVRFQLWYKESATMDLYSSLQCTSHWTAQDDLSLAFAHVARAGGHAEVVADGWQGKKEEQVKKDPNLSYQEPESLIL